ncbi:hypothetical protein BSKO_12679 [Bryopsis sp. KO-2023]|nr:hypothetical protein BSKO_12679 [Bryopsis sp. KO-2023]
MRGNECVVSLTEELSKNWPESFLQAFLDPPSGNVVVVFDAEKCSREGNLLAYMNRMLMDHLVLKEFGLRRDAHKWGFIDKGTSCVFFCFVAPWGKYRPTAPLEWLSRVERGRKGQGMNVRSQKENAG